VTIGGVRNDRCSGFCGDRDGLINHPPINIAEEVTVSRKNVDTENWGVHALMKVCTALEAIVSSARFLDHYADRTCW